MFVNNYRNILASLPSYFLQSGDARIALVQINGVVRNVLAWEIHWYDAPFRISLGSGANPPSLADYRLQSEWAASGNLTLSERVKLEDGKFRIKVEYNFVTQTQQILREIGLFYKPANTNWVLLSRIVLPENITIPAGRTVKVTFTIVVEALQV